MSITLQKTIYPLCNLNSILNDVFFIAVSLSRATDWLYIINITQKKEKLVSH